MMLRPNTATASRVTAALVAGVAGFASYRHIYRVAVDAGETAEVAAVLPIAVDGLIVVATLAMLDDKRDGRRPRPAARVALVFGVLATLAANIASAEPTGQARFVAALPAMCFLLAVEVLARRGRLVDEHQDDEHQDVDPLDDELRQLVDELGPYAGRRGELTDRVRQLVDKRPALAGDVDRLAALAGAKSTRHVARIVKTLTPEGAPA